MDTTSDILPLQSKLQYFPIITSRKQFIYKLFDLVNVSKYLRCTQVLTSIVGGKMSRYSIMESRRKEAGDQKHQLISPAHLIQALQPL